MNAAPWIFPGVLGQKYVGLLAALLGFILYANTLGHQYVYDDENLITNNQFVRMGLTTESVKLIFTNEYRRGSWDSPGSLYRPIPLLMFALEWQVAPNKPFLGHFINVLLYALTALMLWKVMLLVCAGRSMVVAAAALFLFMAHPVHTEVVANIKSRDEIISFLFGLVAMYTAWRHAHEGRSHWLVWTFIAYTLALFSKESVITLLAVIPFTIWFFKSGGWWSIARVTLVLLLPAIGYLTIRQWILEAQPYPEVFYPVDSIYVLSNDPMERWATAFQMCGVYLKTLLWPTNLVSDMGYPQVQLVRFTNWQAWAGLIPMAGILAVGLGGLRSRRIQAYGALIFLMAFSLFSNLIIIIGTSYGERLMYLPSLGFSVMLAWALCELGSWAWGRTAATRTAGDRGTLSLVAVVVLVYSVLTIQRNGDWKDNSTLFNADLLQSPRSAKLNHNVGVDLYKRSMEAASGAIVDTAAAKAALDRLNMALELYPDMPMTNAVRGSIWMALGEEDKAMADWEIALTWLPMLANVQNGVGYLLVKRGWLKEGEEHLRLAIESEPRYVEAYRNLGIALVKQERFDEAIATWQQGLEVDPDDPALMQLMGMAFSQMGDTEQADAWWARYDERIRRDQGPQ